MTASPDVLDARARELETRLVAMRRELHRHPELAHQEVWTTNRIRAWLEEAGIPVLPLPLETGLVAEVQGTGPGPVVALRTDMDGLPVQEQTGLPFASEVAGRMHACGHDFHMAAIVGAGLLLHSARDRFRGRVRLFFQPAEETASGAVRLIWAGAMEGVQAVFGLHNKPDLPPGTVGIKTGPLMAATDTISIFVKGKGGHAAIPDATVDPVVAGSAIVLALQSVVSRSVSPLDSAVVTVASFRAGEATNVIPEEAQLSGTVRTFRPEVRERVLGRIGEIARATAAGYGAAAEFVSQPGTPALSNDPAMAELMRRAAADLNMHVTEAAPTMGGEDFAEYLQLAPGCFVWLGTGQPEGWHHPRFAVDESVIHRGAALMARAALLALEAKAT